MGEVYLARDTKLGREVALKILPDALARDAERLFRFKREAQTLASLNHPNIGGIYGIEDSGGQPALVLEFVDGETLAERINTGLVPLVDALKIAVQIAEAIEAAHEKNVIHRDLKPANVKITPQGMVKVLDFGLAKALADEATIASDVSHSPTLSVTATAAGVILGTAGYMAPEQARGKPVDRRADIWAFGVLLFEMLTARRAFGGETAADILAKVLEREPDWKALPPGTPAAVRSLLRRCLTKSVKDRLQAIGDARTLIQELLADADSMTGTLEPAAYPAWKKVLPWAVAPLALAAGLLFRPPAVQPPGVEARFEYALPDAQNLAHGFRHGVELSSDGVRMAFVANRLGDPADKSKLYVKNLDQWEAASVAGTEGAQNPFFSPDATSLGFVQGGKIKKVALSGGMPMELSEKTIQSFGISWGSDGSIVFAAGSAGGLTVVRDTGGEEKEYTKLDEAANEYSHRLPHHLPDGSGVLFTVLRYTDAAPDWSRAQIWVKSSKSGESRLLIENGVDARYTKGGHLVFARQGRLFAVGFDLSTLSVVGQEVPVLDGITQAEHGGSNAAVTGAAQFSVSDDGTLLYAPGSIEPPDVRSLVWVDRSGKVSPAATRPLPVFNFARLSPDGRRIIFSEYHVQKDVWVFDPTRETTDKILSEGQSFNPIWSPDGSRIAFRSDRSGPSGMYMRELKSSKVIQLTPGPIDNPGSWSPDGKELVFQRRAPRTNTGSADIYIVSVDKPGDVRPLLNSPFDEASPEFSPDGRWLAYCSTKTGQSELYVQPHPGPGEAVLVSTDGATEPAWSRDGKELFYRSGAKMMAVRYKVSSSEFLPEKPVVLFEGRFATANPRSYDVAPDGRFLMMQANRDEQNERDKKIFPSTLRVVLNWTDGVRRLMAR